MLIVLNVMVLIIIFILGYYCGRFTTNKWNDCKECQPQKSGYYMVTLEDETYAEIWYWDIFEGFWYGAKAGHVVAWRERVKGWRC